MASSSINDSTVIPQLWPHPYTDPDPDPDFDLDLDWDNLFTEPDEIEGREEEGESTQIINPPPHFDTAAAKKRKRNQSIVFSEKIRRKRMRQFLSTLTSILPIPNTKVARYCLIEETIEYIKKLQQQVQDLKTKREQLLGMKKNCEELSSTVIVNVEVEVYGDEVIIRITSFKMPSNMWKIYQVFEAQHLDIRSADVYRGDSIVLLSFCAN
ncbi:hypothetical protein KI387_004093, partial [Taxus chinensis]